jgi:hypothetical protein
MGKKIVLVLVLFMFIATGFVCAIANDANQPSWNPLLHIHLGGGIIGSDYIGGEIGFGFFNGLYLGLAAGAHWMNSYRGPDYEPSYNDYDPDWSLEYDTFGMGIQLGYDFLRILNFLTASKMFIRAQAGYMIDLEPCYWEPDWTTDDYDYLELGHHQLSLSIRADLYLLFFYFGAGAGININTVGIGMEGNAPVAFSFDALFGFGL